MMKCPKCGEEIDVYEGDVEIWSIGEKQVKVHHISITCDAKWIYKRKG